MNQWESIIRDGLKKKSVTITTMARELKISRVGMHYFISKRQYKKEKMLDVCKYLGLNVLELVKLDYEMTLRGE